MQFAGNAVSKIRHMFNEVAQSDTAQGAVLLGSLAFTSSGGNLLAAGVGAVMGGIAGAENLRILFNKAVNMGREPELVPIPVHAKYTGPTGPKR